MKILHLAPDERKFVIVAAEILDTCEDLENSFRVITSNASSAKQFFSVKDNIRVVNKGYVRSRAFQEDLARCDCLVVHCMDGIRARAVMQAPPELPVVWSGWGADYFDLLPHGGTNLLGPETTRLCGLLRKQGGLAPKRWEARFKELFRKFRYELYYLPWIKKAMRRTDFFSSPFPEDFDLLRAYFKDEFHPIYTRVFYGSVERTYVPGAEWVYGENILVGNSATATNNHLEVFAMLAGMDLGDQKIVVPLSYGVDEYRDAILDRGKRLFGRRFQPITEFMPLQQYNNLIAQCSVVVMGHKRQQGGGNTATMLYKGAKVFLEEVNTVYQYFRKRGGYVYTLDDLKKGGVRAFSPLTEEQKSKNREVVENYYSTKVVLAGVREFAGQIKMHRSRKRA
jgi:dTDP-N-acetylfucosamine:lipid II N-acetylfucosaminyltransferase